MMSKNWFVPTYVMQAIWRDSGWGTVIYLAALAGISPELYEAARMDGAGRFRQIWHITLPGIRSTIVVLLLLRLSDVLELSFEHVFLITVATMPILLLYPFLQKHFAKGILLRRI